MQLFLFGFVLYQFVVSTKGQIPCETGWTLYRGSCYYFSVNESSHTISEETCSTLSAYLVKVDNQAENDFLTSFTSDASTDFPYWIQGDDLKTEGEFRYDDNNSLSFTNWHAEEPTNSTDEDCIDIVKASWNSEVIDRAWHDKKCTDSVHFICEKDAVAGAECDTNWNLFAGSCYSISNIKKAHAEAKQVCSGLGAELIKITTRMENDFIASLTNTSLSANSYWIQGGDELVEGEFVFEDGSLVEYTNWKTGNPDGAKNDNCVAISSLSVIRVFYDRQWFDNGCQDTLHFICEKEIQGTTTEMPPAESASAGTPSDIPRTDSTSTGISTNHKTLTVAELTSNSTIYTTMPNDQPTTTYVANIESTGTDVIETTNILQGSVITTEAPFNAITVHVTTTLKKDITSNQEVFTISGTFSTASEELTSERKTSISPDIFLNSTDNMYSNLSRLSTLESTTSRIIKGITVANNNNKLLLESLRIDTRNTFVNRHRLRSMQDERPSAKNIGIVAGVLLTITFLLIFLLDLDRIFRDLQILVNNLKYFFKH